jgi:hypothetical protein
VTRGFGSRKKNGSKTLQNPPKGSKRLQKLELETSNSELRTPNIELAAETAVVPEDAAGTPFEKLLLFFIGEDFIKGGLRRKTYGKYFGVSGLFGSESV